MPAPGEVQPRRLRRDQAQLVPVHVVGTLSPQSQRALVHAFASMVTDLLLDDPTMCTGANDPMSMGEDSSPTDATMQAGGSR
jgi:hypothetical protein